MSVKENHRLDFVDISFNFVKSALTDLYRVLVIYQAYIRVIQNFESSEKKVISNARSVRLLLNVENGERPLLLPREKLLMFINTITMNEFKKNYGNIVKALTTCDRRVRLVLPHLQLSNLF